MVTWKTHNQVFIIPNRKEYTTRELRSMWYTRWDFFEMVNRNVEAVHQEQARKRWIENYYHINFGRYYNIYYRFLNQKLVAYSKPNYNREKYLKKLGFCVLEYHRDRKYIKVDNKIITFFKKLFN